MYGGCDNGDVLEDTFVIVGGTFNSDLDVNGDSVGYTVCAGCKNGVVFGDTTVTVKDDAKAGIVYAGGSGINSNVEGVSTVNMQSGNVMGLYGGAADRGGVTSANVNMTGGTAEQIFGGSFEADVNGDATTVITGGTVTGRIFSGSYNYCDKGSGNYSDDADSHVIGNATLIIGGNANILCNNTYRSDECGVYGGSRQKVNYSNEVSTIILNGDNYKDIPLGIYGNQDGITATGDICIGTETVLYDYLIKTNDGGTVFISNDMLVVTPDDGYIATVNGVTYNEPIALSEFSGTAQIISVEFTVAQ